MSRAVDILTPFPSPTPEHRWAIERIFENEENKPMDRCTFEQTEKNGQKHLACCRGESVPLALQEFKYLTIVPCTPKNLFQCARQFQANGRMNKPDWYRQFVKSVNEDLDDERSWSKPFDKAVNRETAHDYEKYIFIQGCFTLLNLIGAPTPGSSLIGGRANSSKGKGRNDVHSCF
jgi:hypothetical protein